MLQIRKKTKIEAQNIKEQDKSINEVVINNSEPLKYTIIVPLIIEAIKAVLFMIL